MQMNQWIIDYLDQVIGRSSTKRKKFHYQNIEEYLIHNKHKSALRYQEENGYESLVQIIKKLTEEGMIQPQKNSPKNGRFPPLPSHWWLLPVSVPHTWTYLQMHRVADLLNLERYRDHPEWQTEEEWAKIEKVYRFLKDFHRRPWVPNRNGPSNYSAKKNILMVLKEKRFSNECNCPWMT